LNQVIVRLLFTGAFGLLALVGAVVLEVTGTGCPEWLIATVATAAGYMFGHVQANGVSGKH